jgi:hypothetical protein
MKIERAASSGLEINVLNGNERDLQTNTTQSIFSHRSRRSAAESRPANAYWQTTDPVAVKG